MNITQTDKDGVIQLSISGRLDAVSAVEADNNFSTILDTGNKNLLFNLTALNYISSAGLRVLLVVAKRIQQDGGKVVLCSLSDNVKEVFEISGFSSIFSIFESRDEALKSLKN
ncbi:MAG: STAS domain-containing protein [Victivallales bacterium]|nr:STAS domain-containing protein [Victivallales bacterium]